MHLCRPCGRRGRESFVLRARKTGRNARLGASAVRYGRQGVLEPIPSSHAGLRPVEPITPGRRAAAVGLGCGACGSRLLYERLPTGQKQPLTSGYGPSQNVRDGLSKALTSISRRDLDPDERADSIEIQRDTAGTTEHSADHRHDKICKASKTHKCR